MPTDPAPEKEMRMSGLSRTEAGRRLLTDAQVAARSNPATEGIATAFDIRAIEDEAAEPAMTDRTAPEDALDVTRRLLALTLRALRDEIPKSEVVALAAIGERLSVLEREVEPGVADQPAIDLLAADAKVAVREELAERCVDLMWAIELMDTKVQPVGFREDGTILTYLVKDSTWHRVVAIARGHMSLSARQALDRFRSQFEKEGHTVSNIGRRKPVSR